MITNPWSFEPGFQLKEGGELQEIDVNKGTQNITPQATALSGYSGSVRGIVCRTIEVFGEKALQYIIGGKLTAHHMPYDLRLPDRSVMEVKTARKGNVFVITKGQLSKLSDDDLYGFICYKMKDPSIKPSLYVERALASGRNPVTSLRRSINIEVGFIIPRPTIVNFYNTSDIRELVKPNGGEYKGLSLTRLIKKYEENPDGYAQSKTRIKYGRHNFPLYRLG